MNSTATVVPSTGIAGQTTSARVVSIDIFRGLTMAVMIFVNDLASVHGLSKWTYHMPANVDAMTYVDMVFPAFLFIVGMSLPLAVRHRLRRSPSLGALWLHIALRSLALVALGLILANVHDADAVRMRISPYLWAVLGLAGGILSGTSIPASTRAQSRSCGSPAVPARLCLFRVPPIHTRRRTLAELLLSGDSRSDRSHLFRRLRIVCSDTPLASRTTYMAHRTNLVQRCKRRPLAASRSTNLHLAFRQRMLAQPRHGRRGDVADLPG